jgi:predicted GNAT family N-acyltransferase
MNDALNLLILQVRRQIYELMKPFLDNIIVIKTTWHKHHAQLRAIRAPVFIIEQHVTPEFEWDDIDATALHLLATLNDEPIGCLRIIDYHKIGRMAVLKQYRGNGLGAALLQDAVKACKAHGSKSVYLSAQTHAIAFYEKAGFKQVSGEYCDVDIPHVDMLLAI